MALNPSKSLPALFPADKGRTKGKTISKGLWLHRLVDIGGSQDDIGYLRSEGYIEPYFNMGGVSLTQKGVDFLNSLTVAANN